MAKQSNKKLSRKEIRKGKRKEKKVKKNDHYTNRKKPGQYVLKPSDEPENVKTIQKGPLKGRQKAPEQKNAEKSETKRSEMPTAEEQFKKEKKIQNEVLKDMAKIRKKQLLEANKDEDMNIKQLEKLLKINKKKSKGSTKSFAYDGLDYLLEVCDPDGMQKAVTAEKELLDVNEGFDEDFALMTGSKTKKQKKSKNEKIPGFIDDQDISLAEDIEDYDSNEEEDDIDEENDDFNEESDEASDTENEEINEMDDSLFVHVGSDDEDYKKSLEKGTKIKEKEKIKSLFKLKNQGDDNLSEEESLDQDYESGNSENDSFDLSSGDELDAMDDSLYLREGSDFEPELDDEKPEKQKKIKEKDILASLTSLKAPSKRKIEDSTETKSPKKSKVEEKSPKKSKVKEDEDFEDNSNEDDDFEENLESENSDGENDKPQMKNGKKINPDGTWEDIYGRMRAKDGSIITGNKEKYIPPAIRAKMESKNSPEDKKRNEKLSRLRKQIKGLLNRLAESNMHNIASQIEELYMNNSRNDMNDTLTSLISESLISNVIAPERLLMEHVLLITVLHANIGTEIGAHFLQTMAKKFDEYFSENHEVENKMLDNVVNIISQLYNFKLFDSKLIFEMLDKFSKKFEEKDVECILHILKSIGFGLRKDDPLGLKNLILNLQKQAASAPEEVKENSRVKFMLDILLAIKNNNVTKIPNYDTSYSEHLKKIMKGFIRKGNYVTQLNISLDDLLKADERGRWWVVGSAWTGNISEETGKTKENTVSEGFSQKILELARKQRMNTDTRRNIFCIIMSAEDYLDAFEKLLRLGLKNQQEREIIHVILHCCLHEKVYNPYYSVLAQKFCEYDRKYQMTIKYSIWDKLKALNEHSGTQISNMAKLLSHLFIEKGLPISTLKIVQFSELDKITLRFMRQVLLGILLHSDLEAVESVFQNVKQSEKLKMFRDSLRLFIHHFLLRNLKTDGIAEQQKTLLENRAKVVEKLLTGK